LNPDPAIRVNAHSTGVNLPHLDSIEGAVQAGLSHTREAFGTGIAAMRDGARLFAEVAETAWGGSKLLHRLAMQHLGANVEAVLDAAEACVQARTASEVMTVQLDLVQLLMMRTSVQAGELADLAARAAQHVVETIEAATVRLMQPGG
jgi:hypothetical protein